MAKEKFTTTDLPNNLIGELKFAGYQSTITLDSTPPHTYIHGPQELSWETTSNAAAIGKAYLDTKKDIVVDEKLKELEAFNETLARDGGISFANPFSKIVLDNPGENTFTGAISTTATDYGDHDLAMQRYYARTTEAERQAHLDTIKKITVDKTPAEGVMQQELILQGSSTITGMVGTDGEYDLAMQRYYARTTKAEREAHSEWIRESLDETLKDLARWKAAQAPDETSNIIDSAAANPMDSDTLATEPLGMALDHGSTEG